MRSKMKLLDLISLYANKTLMFCGGIFLVGMVVLTCTNIACRIFGMPVRGTFELMGFFGAVTAAFALGYTQIKRGHIAVDILMNRFSDRARRALNFTNSLAGMLFFMMAAWQIARKAGILKNFGEVTETLGIIYYPFTFCVALGCGALSLVFLTDLIRTILPEREA